MEIIQTLDAILNSKMEVGSDMVLIPRNVANAIIGELKLTLSVVKQGNKPKTWVEEMEQLADYGCMGMEREVEE